MGYNINMKKRVEIKKVEVELLCNFCNGQDTSCKVCKGTGRKTDYHYIISDGKIAIDGDTLK